MAEEKMVSVTVRFPERVHRALQVCAREEARSLNSQIVYSLRQVPCVSRVLGAERQQPPARRVAEEPEGYGA